VEYKNNFPLEHNIFKIVQTCCCSQDKTLKNVTIKPLLSEIMQHLARLRSYRRCDYNRSKRRIVTLLQL